MTRRSSRIDDVATDLLSGELRASDLHDGGGPTG